MSEEQVTYTVRYQERQIEDLRAEIQSDLEGLQKVIAYCLSTGGYDSRVHLKALALMEKDTKLRFLEEAQARLKAAVEAPAKVTR